MGRGVPAGAAGAGRGGLPEPWLGRRCCRDLSSGREAGLCQSAVSSGPTGHPAHSRSRHSLQRPACGQVAAREPGHRAGGSHRAWSRPRRRPHSSGVSGAAAARAGPVAPSLAVWPPCVSLGHADPTSVLCAPAGARHAPARGLTPLLASWSKPAEFSFPISKGRPAG